MKTVMIFDQLDANLSFFTFDRDLSHLDGAYINSTGTPDGIADALNDLLYDDKGEFKEEQLDMFPVGAVKDGAIVIVCGFLP